MAVFFSNDKSTNLSLVTDLSFITDFGYIFDELKSNLIVFHQSKTAFYKKGEIGTLKFLFLYVKIFYFPIYLFFAF